MATVDSLISSAQTYASTVLGNAVEALSSAKSSVENVGYATIGFIGAGLPDAPPLDEIIAPDMDNVDFIAPPTPTTPTGYTEISDIDAGFLPTLGAALPELVMPTKPNQVAEFTDAAPNIVSDFVFPDVPPQLSSPLGEAPTIANPDVPVKPALSLPSFTTVMPADTTVAPTNLDVTLANAYATAAPQMVTMIDGYVDSMLHKYNPEYATQMAAIEAQLTKYLEGGTGLNAAVENAIYERARSKNNAESLRVRDAALSDAAARGFTMPTGALMSAMQLARQSGADNNARAASEIVVMQAEMEQKNLQFAVTTSASMRTALLNTTMMYMQNLTSINSQALDYAKTVLNAVIETYNVAVKAFSLKLDAYKAEAQVYEIKLKGALAGIEIYQAEIKAMEALVNVDRARVEVYRARIDSLVAYAGLYKAQIEAVLGRASLEKMKMDIFQMKVQAYSAKVQAKNAEWQGYTASIEGEASKARMYGVQVDAYNAQVNAFKASIDAKAEVIRAQAISNQAKSSQYVASIQGYSATVSAKAEVARTQLENQRQKVVAFQAETAASVAKYQVRNEYYKSTALIGIENAKLGMTSMVQSAENIRKYGETLAHLNISSAQIYGQLAGAAVSGMNTLASQTISQ